MPFWWARRRKPWYTRRRFRRRAAWPKRRKRYYRRRRARRPARRRRRRTRKYKVRRKKKKIFIQQWQPDRIVKCKIKGLGTLVAGAEGRQFFCYTNELANFIQPKAPGGGGFGCEVFTLEYLYTQWVRHMNIWTRSNDYTDLCRYTGTTIELFRHPTTDFVFSYTRQPPFTINKSTYTDFHPVNMLLAKHHKLILSQKSKPTGKKTVKIKIKPPKQMLTKWFFQQQFATAGLFQMQACALNLNWAYYNQNTQSRCITLFCLNTDFYQNASYGKTLTEKPYNPWSTIPHYLHFYTDINKPTTKVTIDTTFTGSGNKYLDSISYEKGFFQKAVLNAWKVTSSASQKGEETAQHHIPITIVRYNPDLDDGTTTKAWFTSIYTDTWKQPQTDKDLLISGRPLWMILFGFWNYVLKVKTDKTFLEQHILVVSTDAIRRVTGTTQKEFPIIDYSFMQGNMPYGEYLSTKDKQLWYPNTLKQQEAINGIVETGPYIPKYANLKESTWELNYKYISYFKWGGPEITDQPVQDPKHQDRYDVPDTYTKTIQVTDPLKNTCQAMLRAWDFRRGIITKRAFERMSENLQIDSSIESDDSETPKKKKRYTAELPHPEEKTKKIKTCLLSLFEEPTCQDQEEDIHKLIQQQQLQQQKLKQNILQLLLDLKTKQRMLQLQAGIE
nr:MAG: ORF1 [Torque teno midi virus]